MHKSMFSPQMGVAGIPWGLDSQNSHMGVAGIPWRLDSQNSHMGVAGIPWGLDSQNSHRGVAGLPWRLDSQNSHTGVAGIPWRLDSQNSHMGVAGIPWRLDSQTVTLTDNFCTGAGRRTIAKSKSEGTFSRFLTQNELPPPRRDRWFLCVSCRHSSGIYHEGTNLSKITQSASNVFLDFCNYSFDRIRVLRLH